MPDIVHRIGIRAPASAVVDAVSTIGGIADWWTRGTSGSSGVGGSITVRFQGPSGDEIGVMRFQVTDVVPATRVRWAFTEGPPDWIGTEVTFDLSRDGEYTIVLFGHRRWKEASESMAHCSMKWATFLLSLRAMAETGAGRPAPEDLKIDNWN